MSRKKAILSARVASNIFLPFACPSPNSTISCCYLCLHHHVWCSKPSAKCWTSSGKLWLRHLPLLSKLLESRFQLRTPTDKLCQVFQGHLKGLGFPAVPLYSYTSVAKPFVSQFNLLLDAACSDQRCRTAAVQCLPLQAAISGRRKMQHQQQSSSGRNYCFATKSSDCICSSFKVH